MDFSQKMGSISSGFRYTSILFNQKNVIFDVYGFLNLICLLLRIIKAHKKEVERPLSRYSHIFCHLQLKLDWDVCFCHHSCEHFVFTQGQKPPEFHIQQLMQEGLLFIYATHYACIFLFNPPHNLSM